MMRSILSPILAPLGVTRTSVQHRVDGMHFACACCSSAQRGLMALTRVMPEAIFDLPPAEREARAKTSPDLAVLDSNRFFIRAVLRMPILRCIAPFEFGVWAEVAKQDFRRYLDEYDNPNPQFGPLACSLNSDLAPYTGSIDLPAFLTMQPNKHRPLVWFEGADHDLARDQSAGLTLNRLSRIYRAWGHDVRL